MKRFRLQLSVAAFAVLPIGTLSATAQEAFLLDEITVFANLAPTPLRATGTSVTIITEEDLRGVGDVQLSSYLSRLPGISVSQSGHRGRRPGCASVGPTSVT
jgi:vitamin B12 transporter